MSSPLALDFGHLPKSDLDHVYPKLRRVDPLAVDVDNESAEREVFVPDALVDPVSTILEVKDLVITYENQRTGELTQAVDNVSLDVAKGEFVTIVGLSGCGKSSFLNAVAGLLKVADGTMAVSGRQIKGPGADRSVVFQKATLLPWRTVEDNIIYGLEMQGVTRKVALQRAKPYIELVQLRGFEHFHPSALSGGMQQRVNLARALVTDPDLLLLDEPFAALDAITRENMQNELLTIWDKTHKTVLMVTHQIDEAVLLSDRVIIFSNRPARIVAEIRINLPRPRSQEARYTARFDALTKEIFGLINKSVIQAGQWSYDI
jgi:NitT/TauT family transport system ATP-binding protein